MEDSSPTFPIGDKTASSEGPSVEPEAQSIILFYKYHVLSSDRELMEPYRNALENLCEKLHLRGRILIGCGETEGINGTLSGSHSNVLTFTHALLEEESHFSELHLQLLQEFWRKSHKFAKSIGSIPLVMASAEDFKWSKATLEQSKPLFPDLNVKLVKEMIGTGGTFSNISLNETGQGYMTPREWHEEMKKMASRKEHGNSDDDMIIIDCRNHKEWEIGHFPGAVDPNTKTFDQFPHWVQREKDGQLKNKKRVLMYCTGGIRCEKASAYIRRTLQDVEVKHLMGGIHKYLEEYDGKDESGDRSGLWKGKNFVFDGRGSASTVDGTEKAADDVVGKCLYCSCPYDTFVPQAVCTVCREPILVCEDCRQKLREYHCSDHTSLLSCYFTNLSPFSKHELEEQKKRLEVLLDEISVGKKYKQRRKTLKKQIVRIQHHLVEVENRTESEDVSCTPVCRSCADTNCDGYCWGFHGLKRKERLEQASMPPKKQARQPRVRSSQRKAKLEQRDRTIDEMQRLGLSSPPCAYRDEASGIRVTPPCVRVLQTLVKGKWCGSRVLKVVRDQFAELSVDGVLDNILKHGLLKCNGVAISQDNNVLLKNSDSILRVVHWHEPPVLVPERISVVKMTLPEAMKNEFNLANADGLSVYVCDKPSTVPVHPAGPYLSNSLTVMVEAQENIAPRSLIPCHRIDRATSGLTMCCTDVQVARIIQGHIDAGEVKKLYLARVTGKFPCSLEDCYTNLIPADIEGCNPKWVWLSDKGCLEVDAPIETIDPIQGRRAITANGKPSVSRMQYLSYHEGTDTSLVACSPLTGRSHQLRVHLQWLGYPIMDDIQYGGKNTSTTETSDMAINLTLNASENVGESRADNDILERDIKSAKAVCQCCNEGTTGVKASFTNAQLLGGGHSIGLHALRYSIPFRGKKSHPKDGDRKSTRSTEIIGSMDFEVSTPPWAKEYGSYTVKWL